MPFYNSEKYILEALKSIQNQTFKDFECILINDGSKDKSRDIVSQAIKGDNRFILIDKENTGVGDSLRIGVIKSRGEYIARMDADDISHVNRFEEQIKYLKNNPNVNVLGCWYYIIDSNDKIISISKRYSSDRLIKTSMLLGSVPVAHPTVMFKKEIIIEYGNYKNTRVEDHELWTRVYNTAHFSHVKKILFSYRNHMNQTTKSQEFNSDLLKEVHKQTNKIYLANGTYLNESLFLFFKTRDISHIESSKATLFNLRELLAYHNSKLQKKCLICRLYFLRIIAKPIILIYRKILLEKLKFSITLTKYLFLYILGNLGIYHKHNF